MANNLRMLQGYKVLDICQYIAGPTCTRMLAEMGADVVKIEPAPGGDRARSMTIIRGGMSTYFFQHNHSKRGVAMDLSKARARELIKAMVPKFDVLVENFATGVMARMGLDYPALRAIHPALIMCSISMAGQDGPLGDKPGFDVIGQAYAGVTDLVGEPDRPPAVLPMAIGDISTGVASALAVAVAIIDRMRTGEGQHIDASLVDTYFHMHAHDVPMVSLRPGRYHPKREGAQSTMYPPGLFRANGGYIVVMATGHQWREFTGAIGMPELVNDPRFKDARTRFKNNAALREVVEKWLADQPSVEAAVEVLGKARIPCAPVLELKDAMRHPHLVGRKTIRRVHDSALGDFDIPGMPMKFSAWPDRADVKAPRLGEHNEEVLRELLGLSDGEIADLYAEQVLVKDRSQPLPKDGRGRTLEDRQV